MTSGAQAWKSFGSVKPLRAANLAERTEAGKADWGRRTRSASTIFLIWTAVGLFQVIPGLFKGFREPEFIARIAEAWTWALLTPGLIWIDRRLAAMEMSRLVFVSLLLSVPFSLVHTYLFSVLLYPMKAMWWNPLRQPDFGTYYFVGDWLTYGAAIGILQALRYHHRSLNSRLELEQLGRRLVETRLDMLRTQLEPHFLFNALNTVSAVMYTDLARTDRLLADLGRARRLRHAVPLAVREETG